jgi:hypothetical protein
VNCFMVYDNDIHQLNLGSVKDLKFLMKFHSFSSFFAFSNNKCIIIFSL